MGILGSEMGCILATVLREPALMKGCCFSPPSNHILCVHVGKEGGVIKVEIWDQDFSRSKVLDLG